MLMDQKVSVNDVAREFYTILAVENILIEKYQCWNPVHRKLYSKFKEYKEIFTSKLKHRLFDYITLVCAGEARHAKSKCARLIKGFDIRPNKGRTATWDVATQYDPMEILQACNEVFSYKWSCGFGGDKWKDIADHGLKVNTEDTVVWIDHCFDLEHNGGTFFDKEAGMFSNNGSSELKRILDYKLELQPTKIIRLFMCSTTLQGIINNMYSIGFIGFKKDYTFNKPLNLCSWEFIPWEKKKENWTIAESVLEYVGEEEEGEEDSSNENENVYDRPRIPVDLSKCVIQGKRNEIEKDGEESEEKTEA